jgi:hypothetical protein
LHVHLFVMAGNLLSGWGRSWGWCWWQWEWHWWRQASHTFPPSMHTLNNTCSRKECHDGRVEWTLCCTKRFVSLRRGSEIIKAKSLSSVETSTLSIGPCRPSQKGR